MSNASSHDFFIGTYTKDGSRGIYATRLDARSGALSSPSLAAETANPNFLASSPRGEFLYALQEVCTPEGKPGGGVSAFTIDPTTRALAPLNSVATGGASVSHLALDATQRMLIAVSYGGGYIVSFALLADGRIGTPSRLIAQKGQLGPNPTRQDRPHPHSVTLSPDQRFALVADLGLDAVFSYRVDAAAATLTPNDPPFARCTPGCGPRHGAFSRDGRFFYVLGEIDGSVTACTYDAASGEVKPFQHITTLPPGFKVADSDRAAEVRVHPNGRFLYASNRGHDSIAVFAVDAATGALTTVELTPCGGKAPRNFALTADGAWLVCAHQDSGTLCSFSVNPATGKLIRVPGVVHVPQAVCVLGLRSM